MNDSIESKRFIAQDRAITLVAIDLNPAMMSPDILGYSGVIPTDWEMASDPVYTPSNVQITFTNGVNILAQGHQVIFAEPFEISSQIAALAQQFIRAFPNLQYKGSTLNLRGYLPTQYPPGHYISDTWLAKGPWQDDCARAALNLVYKRENSKKENPSLELALTEAMMNTQAGESIPIILFSGRYGYAAKGNTSAEIGSYLAGKLDNIQQDTDHYSHIVNSKFVQAHERAAIDRQPKLALTS